MLGHWGHAGTTSNGWAIKTATITTGMLTREAVRQMLLFAGSPVSTHGPATIDVR